VGARDFLIAYNVNLDTTDLSIAKKIAKTVREKDGGLPAVRALGLELKSRNMTQVSMNLVDFKTTQIHTAFDAVGHEAAEHNIAVAESEVIGLVPLDAVVSTFKHYLKLPNFTKEQVIESQLLRRESLADFTLSEFLESVASVTPTPGGGSSAAFTAALGAALLLMVCHGTLKKTEEKKIQDDLNVLITKIEPLKNRLLDAVEKDSRAFERVLAAYKTKDRKEIHTALKAAAEVPFAVGKDCTDLLTIGEQVLEKCSANVVSDAGTGLYLIHSALRGVALNVKINLAHIDDPIYVEKMASEMKGWNLVSSISMAKAEKLLKERL
jgi:formiminotetrahydrofolate cyclodeaminase